MTVGVSFNKKLINRLNVRSVGICGRVKEYKKTLLT